MGRQISRWKVFRENQLIKRFYENTRAGSPLTANYYIANLGLFLEYVNGIEGGLFTTDRDKWIKIMKDSEEGQV